MADLNARGSSPEPISAIDFFIYLSKKDSHQSNFFSDLKLESIATINFKEIPI